MLPRRSIWLTIAGALIAAGAAGAIPTAPTTGASARAVAIRIYPVGQDAAGTAQIAAPPDSVLPAEAFAYPADGSIVRVGSTSASVSATADEIAQASAIAELKDVQLFNGEITIARVLAQANVEATADSAGGDTVPTSVEGLVALGQPVALTGNGQTDRIPLGDWGYMRALVQTTGGGDPGAQGYHQWLRAIDIYLTSDHGGLAAGSEIILGWAEAFAQARPQEQTVTLPPSGPQSKPPREPAKPRGERAKGAKTDPKRPVRPIPRGLEPKLTGKGYVFPVYGPSAAFGESFQAPRADTGWHHGADVFAPTGTPVLAVADGTVFSVGWNDLGGNRFWLRDRKGNEFYYAHLSAFSPLAVNRTHVTAGSVIGFVGTSGDAISTPPHLHFEIHPAALLSEGYDGVVDPYPYLVAWKHLLDINFPAGTAEWLRQLAPRSSTFEAGAMLLHAADISTLPRLDKPSLERLLAPPASEQVPIIDRA